MVKKSIAVARGDGIGAEIMDAVISIFNAVNIPLDYKLSKKLFTISGYAP